MTFAIAALVVALYVWQDGVHDCQDGRRYTSRAAQPSPFNRRFNHWPPRVLAVVSWASLVGVAGLLGSWPAAVLFVTLPGVYFCAIMPTTVDGPALLCAWGASLLWPSHHAAALALSCLGGLIHERAPVFAALYAWTPWLLAGLSVSVLLALRGSASPKHDSPDLADRLVGHRGLIRTALAHKPHVDMLNDTGLVWSLRGVVPLAAWLGAPVQAWVALGVAYLSRLVATDTVRSLLWAAPPLIAGTHAPVWAVALHAMSFKRASR